MQIGIFIKNTKKTSFSWKLKEFLENHDYIIELIDERKLNINSILKDNDFIILKSKSFLFLQAAFYLEQIHVPVFPDPIIAFKHRDRIEAYYLIKNLNLNTPPFYMGTMKTIEKKLNKDDFPIILKPLMSSGSKGIQLIKSKEMLNLNSDKICYFQKFIKGTHYLAYFIQDEACLLEKPPLSDEHAPMKQVPLDIEVQKIIKLWKTVYDISFGHLDLIKEEKTNIYYIVDVGCFPEFTNWRGKNTADELIGKIILNKIKQVKCV
ncbi:MAG: ATP-grasp domain-containing protein [Promethearchaeota archaeon]